MTTPADPPGSPRAVGMWRGKMAVPEGWDEFNDQDATDWYDVALLADDEHGQLASGGNFDT
jgi:hypothetical protein